MAISNSKLFIYQRLRMDYLMVYLGDHPIVVEPILKLPKKLAYPVHFSGWYWISDLYNLWNLQYNQEISNFRVYILRNLQLDLLSRPLIL